MPGIERLGRADHPRGFLAHGAFGWELLRPEALLGLKGLDYLTHSLFWSLLANVGAYVAVSLWRAPSAAETSDPGMRPYIATAVWRSGPSGRRVATRTTTGLTSARRRSSRRATSTAPSTVCAAYHPTRS